MNFSLQRVAGVDEAGRGPLAGPVVTAAVILPSHVELPAFCDSKTLSPKRRAQLCAWLFQHATVGVALACARTVDEKNIRQATLQAMAQAVLSLSVLPDNVLVDGRDVPPIALPCRAIVGGDATVPAISAASIVAKEVRDALMLRADLTFPHYGFGRHKGYGTADHLDALQRFGPCPLHRFSFAPVATAVRQTD